LKTKGIRLGQSKKALREDKRMKARTDESLIKRIKPEKQLSRDIKKDAIRSKGSEKRSGEGLKRKTFEKGDRLLRKPGSGKERDKLLLKKRGLEEHSKRRSAIGEKHLKSDYHRGPKIRSHARFEEGRKQIKQIHHHKHKDKHIHIYRDRHRRLCHRIVWPRYRYRVIYHWGPLYRVRYVYPYYHRKYVFVSIGGYWPSDYRYVRYYWYGWHPYEWYGYHPVPYEVQGDTYNYYTYNNYYSTEGTATADYGSMGELAPVDEHTFADVRERQAAQEPDAATLADSYFEKGVEAFEQGQYTRAADLFAKAMELAPEDIILPFAYIQALFAGENYKEAASVLRLALSSIDTEEEGIFYPRGLYPDDETLPAQIDVLKSKAELTDSDYDLHLLLGYQLLGISDLEPAEASLRLTGQDPLNTDTANILLDLLEQIKATEVEESSGEQDNEV